MSSLLSRLQHGLSLTLDSHPNAPKNWRNCAKPIGASSIYKEVMGRKGKEDLTIEEMKDLPCVRLPFPVIWVESNDDGARLGSLIFSDESPQANLCFYSIIEDWDGVIHDAGALAAIYTTDEWRVERSEIYVSKSAKPQSDFARAACWTGAFIGCEVLARLNCKNVSLVAEGPKQFKPGKERKGIVWHTIKVDSVPKFRTRIGGPEVNHIEYRSHWVRGHYADYSKGNGLFGKYKGVYWMPEHQRGSEDVGEVIADYEVA